MKLKVIIILIIVKTDCFNLVVLIIISRYFLVAIENSRISIFLGLIEKYNLDKRFILTNCRCNNFIRLILSVC